MTASFLRMALVLGLLSAIGPFAIDMYLPALPAIGSALHADVHVVQSSLLVFFLSFALSQIVYGPASDIFGRKPPLYVGIVLFVAASIGCALAPDADWLIGFRFLQGLGAGAPIVVPRAIVRDLHTGAAATRLMSMLMLVFSVSPILATLLGSVVIDAAGWRAIFWVVGAVGVLGLGLAAALLPETRSRAARIDSDVRSTLRAFARLLQDARFLGLTGVGACGMASFFIYLANSSFVLIDHYGLTPRQYSLAFAINAASYIGMSQFAGRLSARHGLPRVIAAAVFGLAFSMVVLLGLTLGGIDTLAVLLPGLLVGYGCLGLVVPTCAVLALEDQAANAGAASALMGTLQLVSGAAAIALTSRFVDGSAVPMVAAIALAASTAFALARWTLGGGRRQASHVSIPRSG
ncbi:MAG: multidrug effflux MFS transporter [Pseudomonadota bacterium]|nr:multidrug effflux MFS transporter [Pseudomonadota bacterium]